MPKTAFARALLALAVLAGLAGGTLWVVLVLRPPCLILRFTGFACAGCGFSRMVSALLQGDVARAFRSNPYWFCVLPVAVLYVCGEAVCFVRQRPPLLRRRWALPVLVFLLAAAVVFTVARNLPV